MKFHSLLLVAGLAPAAVFAAPTVTFQGEVSAQTCQAMINGETNSTVLLPTVSASQLAAAGATAGLTPFTISLTGCQAPTSALNVSTKFLGHSVTAAGNLGNVAASDAAPNVQIQLTTNAAGTTPVVLNGVTSVPGLVLNTGATSASYQFGARYVSESGSAGAGAVTAVAEYSLEYL